MASSVITLPAGTRPPGPGRVQITDGDGNSLTCWVFGGPAKMLPEQFGGYGSTPRTGRVSLTVYQGVDVAKMYVPVLLDGWRRGRSVEPDCRLLEAMASPGGVNPPRRVLVLGAVPQRGRTWVIASLTPGDVVLRRASDESRLRQDYQITLAAPPHDDVIVETPAERARRKAGKAKSRKRTYTVRSGDTLHGIALHELGSASRWHEIAALNDIRDPKHIKVGQSLRLP